MVARKPIVKKDDKQPLENKPGRKAPKGQKFDALPTAIVDGKIQAVVGDELVISRGTTSKTNNIVCVVKEIKEDFVDTWDETNERWYPFRPSEAEKHGIVVKKMVGE
jgi:hypothetical protein